MWHQRTIGIVLALAAVSLTACGTDVTPLDLATPVQSKAIGEGAFQATYPADIVMSITGDMNLDFEDQGFVDIYEILGGSFPAGTSLLTASVGIGAMTLGDNGIARWSADLVPGQYNGPGDYVIDGKLAPGVAPASGIRSAAYFSIVGPGAGPDGAATYNVLVEPCVLTYVAEAVTGKVVCPKLGHESDPDRTISWTWTWERVTKDRAPTPSFPPPGEEPS